MIQIIPKVPQETTNADVNAGLLEDVFVSPKTLQDSKYLKADNTTPEADQIVTLKDNTGKETKNTATKIIPGDALFRKTDGFPSNFNNFQNNDFGVAKPLSDAWIAAKIAGILFQFQPNTWKKITKTFTDFSTAAATNTISSGFILRGAEILRGVFIKHGQNFTGGAISNYTISVGITGNLDKYASAFNVFQAVDGTVFQLSLNYVTENALIDTDIKLTAISTGANLNAATQGSVNIYFITERIEL